MKRFLLNSLTLLFFHFFIPPLFSQAVQNAAAMGKGINFSGMEFGVDLKNLPSYHAQMPVLKNIGVKTVRLPIDFARSFSTTVPVKLINSDNFTACDSFISWAKAYNLNLSIDFHGDPSTTASVINNKAYIASVWKYIAKKYAALPSNQFYFELFNEPHDVTTAVWKPVAQEIIDSIRLVAPNQTIIVGGADYNSINSLNDLGLLKDNNIIYTFHTYDPFLFSHQGASWVGDAVSTLKVPYPYDAATMPPLNTKAVGTWGQDLYYNYKNDGNDAKILATIKVANDWSKVNNAPIFCGEFGSFGTYSDEASRCRHMKAMRGALESLKIPYAWWELLSSFSFFNGNPLYGEIPTCFQESWGLANYKALPAPSTYKIMDFDTVPAAFGGDYDNGCANGYQVVANPYKNALNNSDNVGKFTKCVGAKPYSAMYLGFANTLNIPTNSAKKFCLKVYFEQNVQNTYINIQQGYGAPPYWSQTITNQFPTQQWSEVCFDLTKNSEEGVKAPAAGNKYTQFILGFDLGITRTTNQIYYFDDVVLRDVNNTPTTEVKENFSVNVYPNPVNDVVNIVLNLERSENVLITISDILGKTILLKNYSVLEGYSALPISVINLTSGVYTVTVGLQNDFRTLKLVKQ